MKIIVDNNLSGKVALFLNRDFKASAHVEEFGLDENTEDREIWEFAKRENTPFLQRIPTLKA